MGISVRDWVWNVGFLWNKHSREENVIIRLRRQDFLIFNYSIFPRQESCQMKALHDITMMIIMEMVITMMGHWISRRKQTVSLVGEGCWCPMVLHACPIAPPSILILFHPPHCDPLPPLQSMHLHNRHILAFPLSLSIIFQDQDDQRAKKRSFSSGIKKVGG